MTTLLDIDAVQVGETHWAVRRLEADVAVPESDVSGLKDDVRSLRSGFVRIERQLGRVETRVEAPEVTGL